jgi:hypothetical protein
VVATAVAVLQVQTILALDTRLLVIALGVIASQAVYAILRIIWYGKRCQCVLYALPEGSKHTYIWRLDQAVVNELRRSSLELRLLSRIHGVSVWLAWIGTSALTFTAISIFGSRLLFLDQAMLRIVPDWLWWTIVAVMFALLIPWVFFKINRWLRDCD